jgi:hypothetical protein
VVLDAMASGLPPIVGERSGAAALVRERDCGLVVSPKDGAALAAAMQALQDPARRARLAVNARNAVLPFTAAAMTLKAVLLYRDLLAATVPPRRADPPAPGTQPAAPDDDVPTLQREAPASAARRPDLRPDGRRAADAAEHATGRRARCIDALPDDRPPALLAAAEGRRLPRAAADPCADVLALDDVRARRC